MNIPCTVVDNKMQFICNYNVDYIRHINIDNIDIKYEKYIG